MKPNLPPPGHELEMSRRSFAGLGAAFAGWGVASSAGLAKAAPATDEADLVIWDSTPSGLAAAVAAARAGLSVLVLTEDKHLGGLQTSGLGFTNAGKSRRLAG